ncbi:hypothetical protein [Gimesia fumaroli]|jgi:hypothetical protein|uniref:Suppressor of fused protein (SUFU) n=1 Tax=Gimesia fumaroli TaxID=2527976 RepID=A0A518IEY1_9PLAN|nr:hypothetical protein [Gimesia fumaroli]QDV51644.1 hypothetical protein Enr17x_37010 [Gimesia fumaroli]
MGFLKRFLKTTYRDSSAGKSRSSFESLSEDQLETHLNIAKYGNFMLTDAIRPSYDLEVVPQAGYRHDVYTDKETGIKIPVLMASASKEILFDLFIDLLDPLGNEVDVVLETSHEGSNNHHQDLYREHMDLPVLKSTLYDYEDLLLNDGCAGIAVLNPLIPLEVQFDEHKLLIMYGQGIEQFEYTLEEYGIPHISDLKFITEAEHVHSSSDESIEELDQLKYRLGIDFE